MKKILNTIFIVAGIIVTTSCSFFEVEPQVICSDTFYNTEKEVQYGLAGVYGVMSNEELYGNKYSQMILLFRMNFLKLPETNFL